MIEAELMNVTKVCQSFPELEAPQIKRDNIISTIDDAMFDSGIKLVAVEGKEGIGRTTLLAQFALAHCETAISLFLRPESRWGYDLKMVEVDIVNQLHWIVNEEEIKRFEDVDDGLMRQLILELQRNARRKKRIYYFVVDGIDEISSADHQIREMILDMLPWNFSDFRFLLSGELSGLPPRICQNVKCKPLALTSVTFPEASQYFSDLRLTEQSVRDVHKICHGMPSAMASVRRILQSGTDVNELLAEAPTENSSELFEIEWRTVDEEDENQIQILALFAYSQKRLSIQDLSRMLGLGQEQIFDLIQKLPFVSMDEERREIAWISEAFRKFAQTKLVSKKNSVTDLIITDLQQSPESETSLMYLPDCLKQAGRLDDLLHYFSPNTLAKMIETTQSLRPLRRTAELGVESALKLQKHGELMSFGIYKAAVAELDAADIWHSEIQALMKLKKYDAALALAQIAQLQEDRLNLLAIISRIRREQGVTVEAELLEQIQQLYSLIDPIALGRNRAIGIASNLIFCMPDLAIELVEKAAKADSGENALDWAFALLSIPALLASQTQTQPSSAIETIRSKINVPSASLFSTEYGVLLGESSGEDIIRKAEKLESSSDRIYILRMWARNNKKREDAISVVDYALKLAIKTTAYVPNATVFRELAAPLPFIKDHDRLKHVLGILDSQRELIERAGPTEDYVRLQLLLAKAESTNDLEAARSRLIDVYLYVTDIKKDLVIKADCMGYLLATLSEVDPEKKFESQDQIHELVEHEIRSDIETLLRVSADHYEVTKGIITALSKTRIKDALSIIESLNTQERRDEARLGLVRAAIKAPTEKIDFETLERVVSEFKDFSSKDTAIVEIMDRLFEGSSIVSKTMIDAALPIIGGIKEITSARGRCKAACRAHALLSKCESNDYSGVMANLLSELDKAWESIDDGWLKVNTGFRIASYLSECAPEEANKYLDLSVQHRGTMLLDNRHAASAYLVCLRLAVRAYGGLLPMNLASKDDLNELARLISTLPSSGEKALIWADLATICYVHRKYEECSGIVTKHVRPLFETISPTDMEYHSRILIGIAPALYCSHRITAFEQIKKMPHTYREMAYRRLCNFLLCKVSLGDPYDNQPGDGYDLTFEEVVDVCELVGLLERDSSIFHFVGDIVDSVLRHKQDYTRNQRVDIANRLERIIDRSLPDPLGIKHEGYKIVSMAQIGRISPPSLGGWDSLIDKARSIPNLADQAFSLGIIAESVPSKDGTKRKELLAESAKLVDQIPVAFERISHYEALARWAVKIDAAKSREYLRTAMEQAVDGSDPSLFDIQRRLIDFAHRIDPDFASSLAAIADDDPARANIAKSLKNRIKMNDLKKKMLETGIAEVQALSPNLRDYAKAAWMCLGALNANRMGTVHVSRVQELMRIASGLNLSDSYPIFAWAIENMIQRNGKTDQATFYLRPMYNATLLGAELATTMAMRSSTKLKLIRKRTLVATEDKSLIIEPGDREAALDLLSKWIATNVRDNLLISDPYMDLRDLEVIKMVQAVKPDCKIRIITSQKNQHQENVAKPWDQTYRDHWRIRISDQDPPDVEILIVGSRSTGELPIHDRWWLSDEEGIALGTSFRSLGRNKDSKITTFSHEETERAKEKLNEYLQHTKREHNGEKLDYFRFTL